MWGAVGPIATLLNTVASYFMSEEGYGEFRKRRQLATLRKAADQALARGDMDGYRVALDELRKLSDAP
jgi:hypothetical protein